MHLLGILLLLCFMRNIVGQFRCANPNRNNGYCVSIYDCPSLIEVISRNQLSNSERQFVQNSQCQNGYGRSPYVCCTPDKDYSTNTPDKDYSTNNAGNTPATTTTTQSPVKVMTSTTRRTVINPLPSNGNGNVLPEPPRCGQNSLADKIYNGKETSLDQYPWMVLLEYTSKSGTRSLNCGGSLINQRYVLTAAHCVKGAIEQQIGALSTVRLGEYDLSTEIDCINNDCNDKVVEMGIEEVIPHPQFDESSENRYHDIALIRLNADVTETFFIKPVCLPLTKTRVAINVGESLVVAGWGRTLAARQSNIKMQLSVPVFDPAACASKFSTRNINLIAAQLCAGGEFAKDSCDGDSGGPLMRQGTQTRWYLEGVVSFGNRCGLEGWPAVYTRVSDYMDWIQQSLKP